MALEPIDNYNQTNFDLARKYAEAWQETCDLKAFLFHRNDIECILSEKDAVAVRFYMGIKEEGETKCPDMMVVGVDDKNKDLISLPGQDTGTEIKTGIYNFTMPCPRTCDDTSYLYFKTGPGIIGSEACASRDGDRIPSTGTACNIEGFQISRTEARASTVAWQTLFNLKSVLFKKEDLAAIYTELGVEDIRVYFGLDEEGKEHIILIGVDANGFDDFEKNAAGEYEDLYTNSNSLCTKESVTTCSVLSPLYHTI